MQECLHLESHRSYKHNILSQMNKKSKNNSYIKTSFISQKTNDLKNIILKYYYLYCSKNLVNENVFVINNNLYL